MGYKTFYFSAKPATPCLARIGGSAKSIAPCKCIAEKAAEKSCMVGCDVRSGVGALKVLISLLSKK